MTLTRNTSMVKLRHNAELDGSFASGHLGHRVVVEDNQVILEIPMLLHRVSDAAAEWVSRVQNSQANPEIDNAPLEAEDFVMFLQLWREAARVLLPISATTPAALKAINDMRNSVDAASFGEGIENMIFDVRKACGQPDWGRANTHVDQAEAAYLTSLGYEGPDSKSSHRGAAGFRIKMSDTNNCIDPLSFNAGLARAGQPTK